MRFVLITNVNPPAHVVLSLLLDWILFENRATWLAAAAVFILVRERFDSCSVAGKVGVCLRATNAGFIEKCWAFMPLATSVRVR